MKNRIRISITIIMVLFLSTPLFASFEAWLGTSFVSHTAALSAKEKENFWIYHKSTHKDSEGNNIPDYNAISTVIFIGPSLDLTLFPYHEIPIGIKLTTQFLFPISYNNGNKCRSYNADFKNRNMIGISYAQTYNSTFGLFAELGYEFDNHRIAKTNIKNNKHTPDYNRFYNNALYGELGFLTTVDNGYFKFGINYSHSLENKASSHDLIFAGGFRL